MHMEVMKESQALNVETTARPIRVVFLVDALNTTNDLLPDELLIAVVRDTWPVDVTLQFAQLAQALSPEGITVTPILL